MRSGAIRCSASLSDSPPTIVSLPSAPSSPIQQISLGQGSVHWGVVGEFSGVPTPEVQSPLHSKRIVFPKSSDIEQQVPLRQKLAPSPTLLQGVSELLSKIDRFSDSSKDSCEDSVESIDNIESDSSSAINNPNSLKQSENDPSTKSSAS